MVHEGWKTTPLGAALDRVSRPVQVLPDQRYTQIGIRSHGRGLFIKDPVDGWELGDKRVFHVEANCLVLNIVFAWEQAVGKTDESHIGLIASHRFPMYRPRKRACDIDFLRYYFLTPHGKHLLGLASPGGAGRNKTLGQKEFERLAIALPPLSEQKKVAEILSTWDKAIETTEKLLVNAEAQKRALMQQLLTRHRRLKGFEGSQWQSVAVGRMGKVFGGGTPDSQVSEYWGGEIAWATPTDITRLRQRFIRVTERTITKSGLKNSSANVLPPGSLLVCTRATVGELAIAGVEIATNQGFKSIVPGRGYDVEFLYYLFEFHKREFVRYACGSTFLELSKRDFEKLSFSVPDEEEQRAIAGVLSNASSVVEGHKRRIETLRVEKRALMQQLLTGKRRVII